MVRKPPVIPTVRVVHIRPPVVVHTSVSNFRSVVQELTGPKDSTARLVSDHAGPLVPVTKRSTEEDDDEQSISSILDHRISDHINEADPLQAGSPKSCTPQLLKSSNACTPEDQRDLGSCWESTDGASRHNGNEQVWRDAEYCFEGLLDEENCRNREAAVISESSTPAKNAKQTLSGQYGLDSHYVSAGLPNLSQRFEEPTSEVLPYFG